MSAQGSHPACESHEVKHFVGFRVDQICGTSSPGLGRFFCSVQKRAISQTGQSKVILMLAFLQADSSKTNPRPSFRTFTSGLRFLAADYIFFVIAHDVVRHNNGPLSRLTLMSRRIPNLGKSSRPFRLINATAYRSDNGIHTNHS